MQSRNLPYILSFTLGAAALAVAEPELVEVTPREIVARALENNFDLRIQEIDVDISRDRIDAARGEFDPVLSLNLGYDRTTRRQNAQEFTFFPAPNRIFNDEQVSQSIGIGALTPEGARYELRTGTVRSRSSYTRRSNVDFDPEYQSTTRFTIIQPLLRNYGHDVNLAQIHLLQSESKGTKHEARLGVETVMGQVLSLCFDLEFASENIRVKEQSLELANRLLGENRRRVEEGRMSPIDVTQAEVRVSEAHEELIQARNFYAQRQNQLRELTGIDYDFDAPYLRILDIDTALPAIDLERDAIVAGMFNRSPIYHSALEAVEAERIRLVYAENQRYPQIDLHLSVGYNGLGGNIPRSYKDYRERDHPDWSVGVEFSKPIGERSARARIREANRRRRQALLRVKQAEVQLLAAMDNSMREVRTLRERRELMENSVRLAGEALNAEERRLVAGTTTSYNVLTQQRELSDARTRVLAADAEVRRAMTQLLMIQGTLADSLGFAVEFN